MYSAIPRPPLVIPNYPLPSLSLLGTDAAAIALLDAASAESVAQAWFAKFGPALQSGDVKAVTALILPTAEAEGSDGQPGTLLAHWRDQLALTWDFRTFSGVSKITVALEARLASTGFKNVHFTPGTAKIERVGDKGDVVWVSAHFVLETSVAKGAGIGRLVPVPGAGGIEWKAHTIYTTLLSLTDFPELSGPLRNDEPNHGLWAGQRAAALQYRNEDGTSRNPTVLVIGAGQSGLAIAARLKYLGVDALIAERNKRVGDNWRGRYEALCLHDTVCCTVLNAVGGPADDPAASRQPGPVYTPAQKLANWLEFYADSLELNVWTSTNITSIKQDAETKKWHVSMIRSTDAGVEERRDFVVNHVVFACGLGADIGETPDIEGMDTFRGQILHSTQHKSARDHSGKKVVVVGACTSAHDIAVDYCQNGVDVTMVQRGPTYIMSIKNGWDVLFKGGYVEGGPPVEVVDRVVESMPHFMAADFNVIRARQIAEMDKELLDGLHRVGFRTNMGIKNSGFSLLARTKAGGYYFDTGASGLIAQGAIKLHPAPNGISRFTPTGLAFPDGTTLDADVVLFATGIGSPEVQFIQVFGEDVLKQMYTANKPGYGGAVWRKLPECRWKEIDD
ncbi:hypothetical protein D9619_011498 [Psilocybe cf. subviscida]|uniref:FAD/NAD(P)-binding domain-containing protein n=1 Tax=Psilocybe cf. subviscida TaxID=2480587 RepID=A0A8H5F9S4_9AGAR|nr:hypothetical protein D9619_011498 [Psilocybe cf. subviscida]